MIAVQAVATSGTALRILLRGSLGIFRIQIATGQTWFLDPDELAGEIFTILGAMQCNARSLLNKKLAASLVHLHLPSKLSLCFFSTFVCFHTFHVLTFNNHLKRQVV